MIVRLVVLLILGFIEIPICKANRVNPGQTPRSVGSDPDLHCLHMSLSRATMHNRVNTIIQSGPSCSKHR